LKKAKSCKLFLCQKLTFPESVDAHASCNFDEFVMAAKMVDAQEVYIDRTNKAAGLICGIGGSWKILITCTFNQSPERFAEVLSEHLRGWRKTFISW